jgi:hypothetical protein
MASMFDNKRKRLFVLLLTVFITGEMILIQVNPSIFDKSLTNMISDTKWWSLFGATGTGKEADDNFAEDDITDDFEGIDYDAEARGAIHQCPRIILNLDSKRDS